MTTAIPPARSGIPLLAIAIASALAAPMQVASAQRTRPSRPAPRAETVRTTEQRAPGPLGALDTARLGGVRWRMIGPARGGRVTAVTGVPQEPLTFYMGATGGGVWKTTDAGVRWVNVSDGYFDTGSIGAIDVADSDPNVVWVGTGSEGIRSNVSIGKGIWRSGDAGKTWTFAGLRDVGQIGAVVVHPRDPNTVWVAAVGNPFAPSPERGVYRTRDGGRSWQRVLHVSDSTGGVDLELQPGNPSVVYATMWRAERKPWTIISGARACVERGCEGGVYRSTDGGDGWTRLTRGLPNGLVGKADLAVSPAAPRRLYVLIEAKPGNGLYRSDDAGESFTAVDTTTKGLITRPFYYTNVDADPTNADVVYVGTEDFYRSTDGGRTWKTMSTPHGDNHDLWINPVDPRIMIQSNDGGANVTLDGGKSWSTQYNQPTAELYQVAVDRQVPYRVYGAQQDNTTLIVPSRPLSASPADDPLQLWQSGPGCETGPIIPHPLRPDTVYGACKGLFSRMSLRTGQERQYWIGAQNLYGAAAKDLIYRFQRTAPMELSPHDPGTLYMGSQYVHRTRDEGVTWERISPDLTWNPPERRDTYSGEPITLDVTGEEHYSTLYAIRESPLQPGVIWTGANDGPFHLTRDGGRRWMKITPPAQPPGCRVQNIEPSPRRAASAYYAVHCYLLGDFRPYLWKTDDYGASWRLVTPGDNGIPADHPTRVVREDPERAGLLYAGTEFGIFVSFDDGRRWFPLQRNLPRVPITDLRVRGDELAASTQGRSFWIFDGLAPLRELSDSVTAARAHLFHPSWATRLRYAARFGGAEQERAAGADPEFPPAGAPIDYWLGDTSGVVRLEILDPAGRTVRVVTSEQPREGEGEGERTRVAADTAPRPAPGMRGEGVAFRAPPLEAAGAGRLTRRPGLNRFVWDLAWPGAWDASARRRGRSGPMAVPGRYRVRLTTSAGTQERPLVLEADPRAIADGLTDADLRAQLAHNLRVRDLVSEANLAAAALADAKKRLAGATGAAADTLRRLEAVEAVLVTPPVRYSRPGLQAQIGYLHGLTTNADQKVGRDAIERYAQLRRELDAVLDDLRPVLAAR